MATVTVACKVQNGLLIRGGKIQDVRVPAPGGQFVSVKQWVPDGVTVKLNGPGRGMSNDDPASANADGYALTFGVDEEFMKQWFSDNRESAVVKSGFVKFAADRKDLKAMTRDHKDAKTGLEPLSPSGDSRLLRSKVTKEEDRKAA